MRHVLYAAPRSPFSRKVLLAAFEAGLREEIAVALVDPWRDERLRRLNPLCKVPTLALGDGSALFDSVAILRYLDELSGGRLVPSGRRRWEALRREALGDGLAEAVIRRFVDRSGPDGDRLAKVVARQELAIAAALDRLEAEPDWVDAPLDVGHVAIAAALDYAGARSPELAWSEGRPRLAGWFLGFRERASMRAVTSPNLDGFAVEGER